MIYKQLTKEQRRELWLPLYGDGFYHFPFWGQSGPCYLGNRDERGLTTHASGKAGPEDWFVVSDPIWTIGKNYLSHSLALYSLPDKTFVSSLITGLGKVGRS